MGQQLEGQKLEGQQPTGQQPALYVTLRLRTRSEFAETIASSATNAAPLFACSTSAAELLRSLYCLRQNGCNGCSIHGTSIQAHQPLGQ
jgi:hypothetical protein